MGSEILRPESEEALPTSTQEVEFALVLSRMIDSVNQDPEHLRATIYELARHKLKEQFKSETFVDMRKLSKSLEVAIQGVEQFSKKNDGAVAALPRPGAVQENPRLLAHATREDVRPVARPVPPVIDADETASSARKRNPVFKAVWRLAAVFAIVLALIVAVKYRPISFDQFGKRVNRLVALPRSSASKPTPAASPGPASTQSAAEPAEPSPLMPTTFGIYAVSGDKLYELDLLPGRAPDTRVAVSALITTPSRATLPDGHLTFIVFRRDSATNAVDRPEVRVIARIAREIGFDKDGKQVMTNVDDSWVMRNISIPYRTAPKKDNPDMYEVQSENPGTPLAPGRYALVLKGQAYDFSVAGPVTDPRQCLERLAATNGQFYSGCQKP
jgi:flagellar hook-basal body complex protein FliE